LVRACAAKEVIEACKKYHAVYFAAIGGAAAVIAQSIKGEKMIAYEDLGPEAIRKYTVVISRYCGIDIEGRDFYREGEAKYRQFKNTVVKERGQGHGYVSFMEVVLRHVCYRYFRWYQTYWLHREYGGPDYQYESCDCCQHE
jgi:hypothetical protein